MSIINEIEEKMNEIIEEQRERYKKTTSDEDQDKWAHYVEFKNELSKVLYKYPESKALEGRWLTDDDLEDLLDTKVFYSASHFKQPKKMRLSQAIVIRAISDLNEEELNHD